ncbi:SMI1/KNR4 family protein [Streptomyces uncialis]|uniref:SMI1/KNR4 family protein n=1 Tax=Streptomyces uncialis TaxID=1048205 RepID=UPI003821F2B4
MDLRQLLWSVGTLTWPDSTELICGESAHPAGHVCVPVPEGTPLDDLVEQLANWYGEPLTEDSELPPSLPAVAQGGWRYAWPSGGRWVALGDAQATDPGRLLLVVAHRPVPAPGGTSADDPWPDRLVTLTGWIPRAYEVDWASVESRLGSRLPSDYKRLVEVFGRGQFDGFFQILMPEEVISYAETNKKHGQDPWEPHPPFPATGGILTWAGSEHEQSFYWVTEDPDPDRWTVYVTDVGPDAGTRFDCTATEFLHRRLAGPRHPFSHPAAVRAHWFQACSSPDDLS